LWKFHKLWKKCTKFKQISCNCEVFVWILCIFFTICETFTICAIFV